MWSNQAIFIIVIYILASVFLAGIGLYTKSNTVGLIIIAVIILFTGISLASYTNCVDIANCNAWSWCRSLSFCLFPIILIPVIAYMEIIRTSVQAPPQQTQQTQPT